MPKITITISDQAMALLKHLNRRGLHGRNTTEVARGLVYEGLRKWYACGAEELPREKPRRPKGTEGGTLFRAGVRPNIGRNRKRGKRKGNKRRADELFGDDR